MIYFLKHIDIEGPGTFGSFLKKKKIDFKIIDLGAGQKLPQINSDVEAVIILGGPMNVYEEDQYSFLKDENQFIKKILVQGIPFMGICLGSQLLSKACGAAVVKSPVKEVGFYKAELTSDGKKDPLFKGLKDIFDVYHWHEDMFQIPSGGKLLTTASGCPNQAFKVGENAYGLQFHVEVTDQSINEWAKEYIKSHENRAKEMQKMMQDYKNIKDVFNQTAEVIYNNFLEIVYFKRGSKTSCVLP
jgi:GMP synthase (glutamine-hydrolysing)